MSRSRLVRALALSVALASSCYGLALAGNCDKGCDGSQGCKCQCAPAPGLLDSLNKLAAKLPKQPRSRVSILSTLSINFAQQKHSCDEPTCGAEPACGAEATCGIEPACGTEPSCGAEPSCGCAAPSYTHASGPIAYPPQIQYPSPTGQSHQHLHNSAPQPHFAPTPVAPNAIPTPVPQDSTVDPFRDDTTSYMRPVRARSASQRISSQAASPVAPRVLKFDPQARARGTDSQTGRSLVKKPASNGSKQHVSDADEIVLSRIPKFVTVERRVPAKQLAEQDFEANEKEGLKSEVSARETRSSRVVTASAAEPARLSPLKSTNVEFDLSSSRNPLRDN